MHCKYCGREIETTSMICGYCNVYPQQTKATFLTGWVCPKCGQALSPFVQSCPFCIPETGFADTCEYTILGNGKR